MTAGTIPPTRMRIPHFAALTGLRGLAAWGVVFFHARSKLTDWVPDWLVGWGDKGYLAVDLFFMLSGFVMYLNYASRLKGGGMGAVLDFWWRRFARIYPLHLAVLAGLVGLAAIMAATGRDTSNYPLHELPLHLLLIQNWGFTEALKWNHPAWSISAEVGAYILFPLILLLVDWDRASPARLAVIIVLLAAALWGAFAWGGHALLGDAIERMGLLRCVGGFTIGIAVAALWTRWRDRGVAGPLYAVTAALFAAHLWFDTPEVLMVPLIFAALLLAIATDNGVLARGLSARPLLWLGDTSYAVYLIHWPLMIVFLLLLPGDDPQIGPALFLAYCAVTAAVSDRTWRWLEKPAQRWLNARSPVAAPTRSAAS